MGIPDEAHLIVSCCHETSCGNSVIAGRREQHVDPTCCWAVPSWLAAQRDALSFGLIGF